MVLQSNPRIRNAKSNEGKTYLMGNVLMMGAGNKAGTGRSATTRYNVKFLKDMGACCKSGYSDDALRVMKVWDALIAEYKRLKEVVTQVRPNQWAAEQTLAVTGEKITAQSAKFPTVPKLTAATAATGNVVLESVATYADQGKADTRADAIKVELNLIRTAWENKSTQNTANGNILPKIKNADHTMMTAAEVDALAPNVAAITNV